MHGGKKKQRKKLAAAAVLDEKTLELSRRHSQVTPGAGGSGIRWRGVEYSYWVKGASREGGTSQKTEIGGDVGRVGDRVEGFWSSDSLA